MLPSARFSSVSTLVRTEIFHTPYVNFFISSVSQHYFHLFQQSWSIIWSYMGMSEKLAVLERVQCENPGLCGNNKRACLI